MPPVEAWKKVLVSEGFFAEAHGQYDCTYCHGGDADEGDMAAAHTGMNADPSSKCATCHPVTAAAFATSQHSQLMGYRQVIAARAGVAELTPGLEAMFEQNCNTCHATCGQCHISRPNTVAKGFVRGHEFVRRRGYEKLCVNGHNLRSSPHEEKRYGHPSRVIRRITQRV